MFGAIIFSLKEKFNNQLKTGNLTSLLTKSYQVEESIKWKSLCGVKEKHERNVGDTQTPLTARDNISFVEQET